MKFECQESCGGKCCSAGWDGKAAFIFLTKNDMRSISKFVKQPVDEFASKGEFKFTRFTKKKTQQWFLKDSETTCRFFNKGKCGIYEVRPIQCRTFPFWPENMNARKWKELATFCPGIGKGKAQSLDVLHEQIEADKELCNPTK